MVSRRRARVKDYVTRSVFMDAKEVEDEKAKVSMWLQVYGAFFGFHGSECFRPQDPMAKGLTGLWLYRLTMLFASGQQQNQFGKESVGHVLDLFHDLPSA